MSALADAQPAVAAPAPVNDHPVFQPAIAAPAPVDDHPIFQPAIAAPAPVDDHPVFQPAIAVPANVAQLAVPQTVVADADGQFGAQLGVFGFHDAQAQFAALDQNATAFDGGDNVDFAGIHSQPEFQFAFQYNPHTPYGGVQFSEAEWSYLINNVS